MKAGPEETPHSEFRLSDNPRVVIGSILAGLAVGHLAPEFSKTLGVIGDIYIDLLKMVVLPFMMAAVIFSLRKLLSREDGLGILPRIRLTFVAAFGLAAPDRMLTGWSWGPAALRRRAWWPWAGWQAPGPERSTASCSPCSAPLWTPQDPWPGRPSLR